LLGRFCAGPESGKFFASAVAAAGKVSHTGWVKVGIMVNERKADARDAVSALRDVLRSRGIEVLLHHPAAYDRETSCFLEEVLRERSNLNLPIN
jgi:hypothetical protein